MPTSARSKGLGSHISQLRATGAKRGTHTQSRTLGHTEGSEVRGVLLAGRPGAGWEVREAAGSAPGLLSAPLKFTHLIRATLSERGREGNREAAFLPRLALPRGGYGGTPWEGPPPTKDSDPQHLLSCPDPAPHACSTHSLTPSPAGGACYTTTPITPSANVCLLSTCC